MRFQNAPRWTGDLRFERRARRLNTCGSKHFHRSFGAAAAHLRSLLKRFGEPPPDLHIYLCRTCGGWHLGRLQL